MLCSYIFAAPYFQKSHTATRVAIFGSLNLRAFLLWQFSHSLFFDKPLVAANRGLFPKSAIFGNASELFGFTKNDLC